MSGGPAVPQSPIPATNDTRVAHFRRSTDPDPNGVVRLLKSQDDPTINTLLDQIRPGGNLDIRLDSDLQIFFLPKIHSDKDEEPKLSAAPELCNTLTEALHIEPFFLTQEAWNSNGFFLTRESPTRFGYSGYSDVSRFLIKILKGAGRHEPTYGWLYLSFCSLWLFDPNTQHTSCVFICFDDSTEIQDEIVKAFENYPIANIKRHHNAAHDALLRAIIWKYDEALWRFRRPIREIEKGRRGFAETVKIMRERAYLSGDGLINTYNTLHELSRHVIHMSETLQAASETTQSIMRQSDLAPAQQEIFYGLNFSSGFLVNLKLRADAFTSRLDNEIKWAYAYRLEGSRRLLEKTVTFLTLIFLPATFVAGFWGMNFITLDPESSRIHISRDIWIFFASAGGLSAFSFLMGMGLYYGGFSSLSHPYPMAEFLEDYFREREETKKRRTEPTAPATPTTSAV
ncbi:hypothetical protein F4805DRAFT_60031 [Annulohypoxylon moriforme]|nr:hypothetical protein F4805DRAFT_60031 [Annulohypoxylon moriforme]